MFSRPTPQFRLGPFGSRSRWQCRGSFIIGWNWRWKMAMFASNAPLSPEECTIGWNPLGCLLEKCFNWLFYSRLVLVNLNTCNVGLPLCSCRVGSRKDIWQSALLQKGWIVHLVYKGHTFVLKNSVKHLTPNLNVARKISSRLRQVFFCLMTCVTFGPICVRHTFTLYFWPIFYLEKYPPYIFVLLVAAQTCDVSWWPFDFVHVFIEPVTICLLLPNRCLPNYRPLSPHGHSNTTVHWDSKQGSNNQTPKSDVGIQMSVASYL